MKNLRVPLEEKEKISQKIVSETLEKAENPYALFTGDKDSLIVLHIIRQLREGRIPLPVLHIDTTVYFPEVYQYIDKMKKLWEFSLVRERNEEALRTIVIAENKELCCHLLKTEALRKAAEKYGIDYIFLAKRSDEQKEDPFFFIQENCTLVNPLFHFSEKDSWEYIKKYNLPYCSLYKQGFRKLYCKPCTKITCERNERRGMQEQEIVKDQLKRLGDL